MPLSSSSAPSVKKIIVTVHGIGDQVRNETALATTIRFCDFYAYPGMVPLGAFYGALEHGQPAVIIRDPPVRPGLSGEIGFAEVYWADIARRVAPLIAPEEAIQRQLRAILAPRQDGQIKNAVLAAAKALDALKNEGNPREVEARQREAAHRLNELANALPDANQRRQQAQNKLNDARQRIGQISQDIERALRETAPQPGKPHDRRQANIELAKRLDPLAQRQAEAIAALQEMPTESRLEPQRARAVRRARTLQEAMQSIRENARADVAPPPPEARLVADWQVIGPFPLKGPDPFPPDGPIDLKATFPGRDGAAVGWRAAVASNPQGVIDLAALYTAERDLVAFGVAEIRSEAAGKGQLRIGSDDTIAVWLNGKLVHRYDGGRSLQPGQDRIEVDWQAGVNRLVVRCGNLDGNWGYVVSAATPRPESNLSPQDRQRIAQAVREVLPSLNIEARAASERLEQKFHGRTPADDAAEELAAEARQAADANSPGDGADDPRRQANALRNLDAPDAPVHDVANNEVK